MWLVLLGPLAAGADSPPLRIRPPGLEVRSRAAPKFDADPSLPPSRCLVRTVIAPDGRPSETEARGCPPKFAELAEAAVDRWSWAPPAADGAPVRAVDLVAVAFTGKGRVPVAPADRCTYALRVTSDGRVSSSGAPAEQCAIWPMETLWGRVPAAGTCRVAIDPGIARDTPGWVVPEDCPDEALEAVAILAAGSLFAEGVTSTRLVVELPDPSSAPQVVGVEIPSVGGPGAPVRIGGDEASAAEKPDPKLAVPEETAAPTVDLSDLRSLMGKPKPKPAPAPEPAPKDEEGED